MDKRYTVFISSTYLDLKDARDSVIRAVMEAGNIPLGMEAFGAANASQWQVITETIDTADYYVLILGSRYGSVDSLTGLSYTEMEFDYAISKNVPYLVFVADASVKVDPNHVDNPEKLKSFKDKAMKQHQSAFWRNEDDLAAKVMKALSAEYRRSPRLGWVRPSAEVDPETLNEMARLSRENAELKSILQEMQISPIVEQVLGRLSRNSFTIEAGPNKGEYTDGTIYRIIGPELAKNPTTLDTLARIASRKMEGQQLPSDAYYSIAITALELFSTLGLITANIVDPSGMSGRSPYFTLSDLGREVLRSIELQAGKD